MNVTYEQFFSFMGLREDPFHVSPDPRFFYSASAHESALCELLYGIQTRQGFMVLTGEAGTGKTSILNQILDWLRRNGRSSAYIFHTHLEPIGLLKFILSEFGVPSQSKSKSELVSALHAWLLRRNAVNDLPVLIIDEAQGLPIQTLDEIRLLLNVETPRGKLLQIILAGQPELEEKLRSSSLRQLRQRMMFHCRLPVLTQKETAAYISSRLATAGCSGSVLFPEESVQDIYRSSRGIPRIVNLLCEHALISAYAERQRVVSPEIIQRIAEDFDLIANPLALGEVEIQPRPARRAAFPVAEKARAAVAAASASVAIAEPVPATPAPVFVPVSAPAAASVPVAAPIATATPVPVVSEPEFAINAAPAPIVAGPVRYRGRRPSPSAVVALWRTTSSAVQRGWFSFTYALTLFARSLRVALFPVKESSEETAEGNERSSANWWVQIEFDIFKEPLAAVRNQAVVAAKEQAVPADCVAAAVTTPAPVEAARYRSKRASASAVLAAWRKTSTAVLRAWHGFADSSVGYVRSVYRSFARDCRFFVHGITPPTPALESGDSSGRNDEKSSANRRVFAPVVNWLRQPFAPGNISIHRSVARSLRRRL